MYTLKHWTRFQGHPNAYIRRDGLRVTLGPRGDIYLNVKAWEALECPKAVELLFDRGRRVIGLVRAEPWHPNSFPVRHKVRANGKVIHASPFCSHFMIKPLRTALFNDIEIDEQGVMSLPLDSITAVTRGSK